MTERERLGGVTIRPRTRELFEILGTLQDAMNQYVNWYEKSYPRLLDAGAMPDCTYHKVCDAFNPALMFMENEIQNAVRDFISCAAETEM